jgi:hypothetical protein
MRTRRTVRYYDLLATRLFEFAASRTVASLARRPQTVSVVQRGRLTSLLHKPEDTLLPPLVPEAAEVQSAMPFATTPALRKRQINVPLIVPLKQATPVGPINATFNLTDESTASTVTQSVTSEQPPD